MILVQGRRRGEEERGGGEGRRRGEEEPSGRCYQRGPSHGEREPADRWAGGWGLGGGWGGSDAVVDAESRSGPDSSERGSDRDRGTRCRAVQVLHGVAVFLRCSRWHAAEGELPGPCANASEG